VSDPVAKDVRAALDDAQALMADMFAKGHLKDTEYAKALVCLAANWATYDGRQDAIRIVAALPDEYLRNVMPAQLIVDPMFRSRADELARYLNTIPAGTPTKEDHDIDLLLLASPRAKA